jgi:ribokinase
MINLKDIITNWSFKGDNIMVKAKICVVGASNMDLISYVPRLPKIGETLLGSKFSMGFGGKGANQAVMAAKLGGEVAMITKLGEDTFGKDTLENFKHFGMDTNGITFTTEAFSGVAPIAVDPAGNNSIIVVSGANDLLSQEDIESVRDVIKQSDILVCQLEIRLEVTLAALRIAKEENVTTIFNPAPAQADLPIEIYQLSDIFCPNESETEILTGKPVTTDEQAETAARELIGRGAKTVILTLGEKGSLLVTAEGCNLIPAVPVKPVDTTGAGDAFIGSLAFFVSAGLDLEAAVTRANQVAAVSVQGLGTQTSFPDRKDLPKELFDFG